MNARTIRSTRLVLACGAAWILGGACAGHGPVDASSDMTPASSSVSHCGPSPTMLVNASSYPVPTDAGPVDVGVALLVVDGADLYYVLSVLGTEGAHRPFLAGAVMRIPVGGGPPTTFATGYVFTRPVFTSTQVIVEADNAWPNQDINRIVSIPRGGGPPTTLIKLEESTTFPVTDGKLIYFADSAGAHAIPAASPTAEGASLTVPVDIANDIAIFGSRLLLTFPQGGVRTIALPMKAGAPVTTVATGLPAGPVDLMSCGTDACWLAEEANAIMKISPNGGAATALPLTGALAFASNVVFDGTKFFAAGAAEFDATTFNIATIPADGGDPVVLVRTPSLGAGRGAGPIAVDDQCLYWATAQGIFSLDKTASGPFEQ